MLKSTFDAFDVDRKGYIEADMVGTIMDMLGSHVLAEELDVSSFVMKSQLVVVGTQTIFHFRAS